MTDWIRLDQGGPGSDTTAIHSDVANEISSIDEKVEPIGADLLIIEDTEDGYAKKSIQIANLPSSGSTDDVIPSLTECYLTLEEGIAGSTSNQTAKNTLHLTNLQTHRDKKGNKLSLYNVSTLIWEIFTVPLTGISIAIPNTTNTIYNVYVYNNAGTLTLELEAWSNSGAGTSIPPVTMYQDGIKVKNGEANKRYIGVVRTTDVSGQCEMSFTKVSGNRPRFFIWNFYNKIDYTVKILGDGTLWGYNSINPRVWSGNAQNKVEFITGELIDIKANFTGTALSNNAGASIGIGLNQASVEDGSLTANYASYYVSLISLFDNNLIGFNYLQANERLLNPGTGTFIGFTNQGLRVQIKG